LKQLSTWFRKSWPALLVAATVLLMVSPFVRDMPLSHDHPVHLFNAWHFWTEMLGRGRLHGWSPFWAFGYPPGDFMPFGPDLWVAVFRAATLGLLSWMTTYSLALAAVLVLATFSIYIFARRFFGTATAVLAAVLFILDPGAWAEGGWYWHANYGVWPVTLAMSFTLLTLVKLEDVLTLGRRRDILGCALLVLASLVTHLLPLVIFPITIALLFLDHVLRPGGLPRGRLLRGLSALALGTGAAAFQIVPMISRAGTTRDLGVAGISLDELGRRIVELRVFENFWPVFMVLGMAGAVAVVRRRLPGGAFFASAAGIFVVLSSDILVSTFHLERLMPGIVKVEARRMLLVAKLFWLVLAAAAVVALAQPVCGWATARVRGRFRGRSPWQVAVALALLAAVVLPLGKPVWKNLYRTQIAKDIQTSRQTDFWQDLKPFLAWSRARRQETKDFYRIAYALPMHDHLSMLAPVFNDTMAYKVGYTPAQEFRSFPMTDEPELYRAMCVKYVLSDHALPDAQFTSVATFGALTVYLFKDYSPAPFSLTGPGTAEMVHQGDEEIRFQLRGTGPASRLKLHVANYPPWEARANGALLRIDSVPVFGVEYPFLMEVAATDGELVFRYVRRPADWLGLFLSFGAAALAGAVAFGRPRWGQRLGAAVARLWARIGKATMLAAGGLALAAAGLIAWRLATPTLLLERESVFRDGVETSTSIAGFSCLEIGTSRWRCGRFDLRASVVSGIYGSHLCMSAEPADATLTWSSRQKVGRFIEGRYDPSQSSGHIRVTVDGVAIGEMSTRGIDQGWQTIRFDTRALGDQVGKVAIEVTGAPLHCFDFRIIR
jgi:hypothetical protein